MKRRQARSVARDGRPVVVQALLLLFMLSAALLLSGCNTWNDMWGNQSPQVGEAQDPEINSSTLQRNQQVQPMR